jgi:hypothetical protein
MGDINISGAASANFRRLTLSEAGNDVIGTFSYEEIITGTGVPAGGTQSYWDNTNDNDLVDPGWITDVVDDATPQLGGDLDLNNNDIVLTEPATDHNWESTDTIVDTIKTGEGGLFALMYQGSDGEWVEADKDSYATRCTRMMLSATTSGSQKLMKSGLVRDDSWDWTPGAELYLGDAGAITDDVSAYTTGDVVQLIGKAETADIIDFDPEKGGIEVA